MQLNIMKKNKKDNRFLDEHRINIQEFANKFKVIFEDEGECGFGRECVGLTNGKNWIAYNPTTSMTFEYIKKYYNDKLFEIIPKDAYHKDDCMVVLGRGHGAIIQLSEWIDKLKELGAIIEKYKTGATGVQAMFSGITGMVVYIPKDKK